MVKVYSKPVGCYGCTFTKKMLNERGIEFEDIDVTSNPEAFEYVTQTLGYASVPVVVLPNGEHWSGLNPDRLKAI